MAVSDYCKLVMVVLARRVQGLDGTQASLCARQSQRDGLFVRGWELPFRHPA